MANLQSVIELVFRGIDQASDVAETVSSGLSDMGDKATAMAQPFADAAAKAQIMEGAMVTLAAVLVGQGVKAASEFQTQFNMLTTLFDASGESVAQYRQDILDYAAGSTQSMASIMASLQDAVGAGVNYADSIKLMSEAEKLAVAQGSTLDDAMGLLTSSINSYGLTIKDSAQLSDLFSVSVRDGKVTVAELKDQLSAVMPIASSLGVGVNQLGAAVAVLTANGTPAAQAITQIKAVLEAISNPTKGAAEAAQEMGIQFNASALQSDGLYSVLKQVEAATGGNAEKMAKLFTGSEALTGALGLTKNGASQLNEQLAKMDKATGATDAAFAKMTDNVALGAQRMQNAINTAFINLGTPLLDEIGNIQNSLADIFKTIAKELNTDGALAPLVAALESAGQTIAAFFASIADNLPEALDGLDFTGLIDAFGDLGTSVKDLFDAFTGGLDLTTVEGLKEALQRIVDSAETLTRVVGGTLDALKPFAEAAGQAADKMNDLDDASKVEFGEFLGSMQAIVEAGPGIAAALIAIGKSGVEMGAAMDVVFGGVKIVINAFQVAFDTAVLAIIERAKVLPTALLKVAEALGADGMAAELRTALAGLDEYSNAVNENLQRNAQELEDGWNQALGASGDKTSDFGKKLNEARDRLDGFKTGTTQSTAAAMDWSDGLKQAADAAKAHTDATKTDAAHLMDWSDGLKDAKAVTIAWGDAVGAIPPLKLPEGVEKVTDAFRTGGTAAGHYATSVEGVSTSYSQVGTATVKATGAFKAVEDSADKTAKKMEEATKKSDEFKLKMEEIASNERIKNIEMAVSLKTEQLKADMERVKATFASIDNTINSTGELLGTLFGEFGKSESTWKQLKFEEWIEREFENRERAMDLQEKLVNAEIERVEAQTAALNRGDALIKIDGAGLQQELEAFMWKILSLIRVRANAEFSSYLLGLGAT